MQESSSKKFKVKTLDIFEKEASKLIKKYPSLRSEIEELVTSLEINPRFAIDSARGTVRKTKFIFIKVY